MLKISATFRPFPPYFLIFFFQTDSAPQIRTDHQKSDKFDFNDVELLHGGKNPPLAANKLWLHRSCIDVGPFEADGSGDQNLEPLRNSSLKINKIILGNCIFKRHLLFASTKSQHRSMFYGLRA